MRDALIILAPVITWLVWFVSLRRTPWALLWSGFCLMTSLGLIPIGLVVVRTHATVAGVIGAEIGFMAPVVFAAFCTEACAREDGEISAWRPKPAPKPARHVEWRVVTESTKLGPDVDLKIKHGDKARLVGSVDPVADWDSYLNLKVMADDMAHTYNNLQVQ